MKKTTLLITLLFMTFISEAQVIIASQDFNTALGWTSSATGWARRTTGGAPACSPFEGAGMARFNCYDLAAGTVVRLTSPAIAMTGATYRVKLKMFRDFGYSTDQDNIKVYINTIGLAGGTLLGTIYRSAALAPAEAADGWYSYSFDIPGPITGNRYINITGTSDYGNNIFIDKVTIEEIPAIDAEMNSLSLSSIVSTGMKSISGVIKNFGSTTINSLDLKWQADSGTIYTQNLTGLSIAPGATYNYNHTNQWSATPGLYSIKVWTSNINGGSGDSNVSNDQIIKSISVASNSTTHTPLYEKFSSSTCPPCYTFNTNNFTPFYNTGSNAENMAFISYQVNWPAAGDPYYTAETGTRVAYYGVTGAPTLYVDSKEGTNDIPGLQADLNAALAVPAYFVLTPTKNLVGNDMTVNVNVLPYLTGTYKLHVAVVEKITTQNGAPLGGTNGETSFKHVMMKMLPNASGTSVDFIHDVPFSTTLTANLSGLFIEEMSDLDVVVFIQAANKNVMQAKYATQALSTNDFDVTSKISLYPNPSNGIVKIKTTETVDVVVTDLTGKVVFTMNQVNNDSQINLSSLQKGIYLAKLIGKESEQTQKIILK